MDLIRNKDVFEINNKQMVIVKIIKQEKKIFMAKRDWNFDGFENEIILFRHRL